MILLDGVALGAQGLGEPNTVLRGLSWLYGPSDLPGGQSDASY